MIRVSLIELLEGVSTAYPVFRVYGPHSGVDLYTHSKEQRQQVSFFGSFNAMAKYESRPLEYSSSTGQLSLEAFCWKSASLVVIRLLDKL